MSAAQTLKRTSSSGDLKDSDIGTIPADWFVEKVGSLTRITTGSKNTQDRVEKGLYPFFVRSATVERINSYCFDGEAVLTAGDGVHTGKIFHYINGRFDCHQRVYMITDFSSQLWGPYFYYVFSARFYSRIASMTAKSSVDSVRMEMIADMHIPIPPLPEQRAIAEALGDVDALIAAQEKLVAKKRAIKTATMQRLLTGKQRLPGFGEGCGYKQTEIGVIPEDWEVRRLEELTSRIVDGVHHTPTYTTSGIPFVTVKSLTAGPGISLEGCNFISPADHQEFSKRADPRQGDVLVTKDGTLGVARIVPGDMPEFSIFVSVALLRPILSIVTPDFVHLFFDSGAYEEQLGALSAGTGLKHIHLSHFREFQLVLPSLPEQEAIARVLTDIDSEISLLKKRLAKTKAIKQGMMQELLTGRTRLV